MFHSTLRSKNTNEDPKTSSIIGTLLLLPETLIYKIFRKACEPHNMPLNNGLIYGYKFWPHWFDDTYNSVYVEPDVIIRCEYRDILIEAKFSDNIGQQNRDQWQKEIEAYRNECEKNKELLFVALGGNSSYSYEEPVNGVTIYKCSWASLLMAAVSVRAELDTIIYRDEHISQTIRIIDLLIMAFAIHGVYSVTPFDAGEINQYNIDDCDYFFENSLRL